MNNGRYVVCGHGISTPITGGVPREPRGDEPLSSIWSRARGHSRARAARRGCACARSEWSRMLCGGIPRCAGRRRRSCPAPSRLNTLRTCGSLRQCSRSDFRPGGKFPTVDIRCWPRTGSAIHPHTARSVPRRIKEIPQCSRRPRGGRVSNSRTPRHGLPLEIAVLEGIQPDVSRDGAARLAMEHARRGARLCGAQ